MRRYIIMIAMLTLGALHAGGRHYDRGYESQSPFAFVEKGAWVASGTASFSNHLNKDYNFLAISGINSNGFNLSLNPKLLYILKDNIGVGLRLSYDRGMLDLNSASVSFSDLSMSVSDCYQIHHKYSAHAVYRTYIPLAGAKRISMFADLLIGGSFKQGKSFNAGGDYITGSYDSAYSLDLSVDSGIVAFLSERLAMELNVGVFGLSYNWMDQKQNQVILGNADFTSAGFMVNLLSLGVGLSYYFL